MPRNIIICCDGTDNQFGKANTNVVRMAQVAKQDSSTQIVYYDPGIGTLPEPTAKTKVAKWLSRTKALAFGTDIDDKVAIAYSHLMDFWKPGDSVYIFGFSRGAYTARVLGGMLHTVGLLPAGNQHLLPYARRIYKSLRSNNKGAWDLCDQFRWSFARPVADDDTDRRFPIHFIGLWDTVSSIGWIWNPKRFQFTFRNPSLKIVRHAVSLDERRTGFRENLFADVTGQDMQQRWFAGVHDDVGGGNPPSDGGIWRVTFGWILDEAKKAGFIVDDERLKLVLADPPAKPWAEPIHESLTGIWWLPEYLLPKKVYDAQTKTSHWELGRGRHRFVPEGSSIPWPVLQRIREMDYSPPNLSDSFRAKVKALPSIPDTLEYHAV